MMVESRSVNKGDLTEAGEYTMQDAGDHTLVRCPKCQKPMRELSQWWARKKLFWCPACHQFETRLNGLAS
jgi:formamidopyrimidine-DNA glycosylase